MLLLTVVRGSSGLRQQARSHVADPGMKGKIYRALANPDLALYKLKNTAYKFSFMLIPISLPFLWLMFFWKRGVAMYGSLRVLCCIPCRSCRCCSPPRRSWQ